MQAVREVLLEPAVVDKVQENLESLLGDLPRRHQSDLEAVQGMLDEAKGRRQNILRAIEQGTGGSAMDVLLKRLTQISEEVEELEERMAELRKTNLRRADLRTTADHIVRFIRQFDELFAAAPADEKKVLLRKCVSEVVIDKDRGVIQIAVRRVPAVSAELEELFTRERKPVAGVAGLANHGVERHPSKTNPATQVAGLSSSGDPNFDQPATFTIRREMPLLGLSQRDS